MSTPSGPEVQPDATDVVDNRTAATRCEVLIVGWEGVLTEPVSLTELDHEVVDEVIDRILDTVDRPDMIELLHQLREEDILVILALNSIAEAQEVLATRYLDTGAASALVNSAMVGHRLPESAFLELCLEVADCSPDAVLFVHHDEATLAAARRAGMQTISVEQTRPSSVQSAIETIRARFGQ